MDTPPQPFRILDLPAELFDRILYYSMRARQMSRALRLRLVNQLFAKEVHRILLAYDMLDDCYQYHLRLKKSELMRTYLAHRVQHEPSDGRPQLVRIREVAEKLALNAEETHRYITALSHRAADDPYQVFCNMHPDNFSGPWFDFEVNFQDAAIYMDRVDIISSCSPSISQNVDAKSLIGNTLLLAIEHSSLSMVECLLQKDGMTKWRGQALFRAAVSGRADLIKLILTHNVEQSPWRTGPNGKEDNVWLLGALSSHSLEIHNYVASLYLEHDIEVVVDNTFKDKFEDFVGNGWTDLVQEFWGEHIDDEALDSVYFPKAVCYGHCDVFRFLIKTGRGYDPSGLLSLATRHGHVEVTQILLDDNPGLDDYVALSMAVEHGHFTIVRMLLEHGCSPNRDAPDATGDDGSEEDGDLSPLCYAVLNEDVRMFNLLKRYGTTLPSLWQREECKKRANDIGVESMLKLLEPSGLSGESTAPA